MNEQAFYRISIKGIAVDETGRFLLTRESNDKREILDRLIRITGRSNRSTRREIKEEASLIVTHAPPSPKYFITVQKADKGFWSANVVYEVRLRS